MITQFAVLNSSNRITKTVTLEHQNSISKIIEKYNAQGGRQDLQEFLEWGNFEGHFATHSPYYLEENRLAYKGTPIGTP